MFKVEFSGWQMSDITQIHQNNLNVIKLYGAAYILKTPLFKMLQVEKVSKTD